MAVNGTECHEPPTHTHTHARGESVNLAELLINTVLSSASRLCAEKIKNTMSWRTTPWLSLSPDQHHTDHEPANGELLIVIMLTNWGLRVAEKIQLFLPRPRRRRRQNAANNFNLLLTDGT